MRAFNVYKNGKKIDVVYYSEVMTAKEVTDLLNSRDEYNGEVKAFRSLNSANIRTVLKNAKTVLFNDDEYFNKDVTGIKNLEDLKSLIGIKGNVYKVTEVGSRHEYKLANSDYKFSILVM